MLELGREFRYAPHDVFSEYPEPLVPRWLRLEVDERVRHRWSRAESVDETQALETIRALAGEGGNFDCSLPA